MISKGSGLCISSGGWYHCIQNKWIYAENHSECCYGNI